MSCFSGLYRDYINENFPDDDDSYQPPTVPSLPPAAAALPASRVRRPTVRTKAQQEPNPPPPNFPAPAVAVDVWKMMRLADC